MADIKINDLVAYTDPVSTDVLPIVDVGNDLTKKVSIADLLENAGTGSAAAPSFSFDGDNNTGVYRPGADQVALTAGGTQALLAESTGITIPGNLTVSGTTTTVDTVNLTVKDKNIELGVVSSPSNTTADGGGITLKGATDKTITWVNSTGAWTFNQPASFSDYIQSGGDATNAGDQVGTRVDPSGSIFTRSANNSAVPFQTFIVGSTTPSIKFLASGAANFSGIVASANGANYSNLQNGRVEAYRAATTASTVWQGGFGSTVTSSITAAGAATFAGGKVKFDTAVPVTLTNGTVDTVQFRNDGSLKIGGTVGPTSGNIQLDSSGAATFAGGAASISGSGAVNVNRSASTNDCFSAQLNGTTNAFIKASGAATFVGIVASAVGGNYSNLQNGRVKAYRAATTAGTVWDGGFGTTSTSSITAAGSATFAADVTINSLTVGKGGGNESNNTAVGHLTLQSNTTGSKNTANGYRAMRFNTTGSENTAIGYQALYNNTAGIRNTANGVNALIVNTTGSENTANGYQALATNTTGSENTANGYRALYFNTTGGNNTAYGHNTLVFNTTASFNTASGMSALYANTSGQRNTATGYGALYDNVTGDYNTATGMQALNNSLGTSNVAHGYRSLYLTTSGHSNTAAGYQSLFTNTTGIFNTASGHGALYTNSTGSYNVGLGYGGLYYNTTGSGNIGIGFVNNLGVYAPVFNPTAHNNRLVLGYTTITNAYVKVAWTVTSDARDKMNFAPVPYGLDFVNKLKPTAYQFKIDRETETPNGPVLYGFKAQDILALEGDNPVIIDNEDADHLKYKGEHLVPVLVNAVQELTAMVKELKAEVAALKSA